MEPANSKATWRLVPFLLMYILAFLERANLGFAKVLVNCIAPATFQSPILEQLPPSQVEYMRSRIPMGRLGEIHKTTALVCWLASDECSFSTAATFDTSGGRTTY